MAAANQWLSGTPVPRRRELPEGGKAWGRRPSALRDTGRAHARAEWHAGAGNSRRTRHRYPADIRNCARRRTEKPFAESDLLKRVEEALSFAVEAQAQQSQIAGISARLASLSDRERQVLNAVVTGKMNKTIAYDLDISIKTVEAHRARVMEKMEAASLAHLIRMVALTGG